MRSEPPATAQGPAPVRDRVPRPLGVLPRHAQTWVMLGIAALMIGVILLSGSPPPAAHAASTRPLPTTDPPDQARIQEYRARLDAEAARLSTAQAQFEAAKQRSARRAGPALAGSPPADPAVSARQALAQEEVRRE